MGLDSRTPGILQGMIYRAVAATTDTEIVTTDEFVIQEVRFAFEVAITTQTLTLSGGGQKIYNGAAVPAAALHNGPGTLSLTQYSIIVWRPPMPIRISKEFPFTIYASAAVKVVLDCLPV
jgi:hypothetical protein